MHLLSSVTQMVSLFCSLDTVIALEKNLSTQKGINETKLMRKTMSCWCVYVRM